MWKVDIPLTTISQTKKRVIMTFVWMWKDVRALRLQ